MAFNDRLNDQSRTAALKRMRSGELDLLVIGGGITGVGAALDAATRGLSVGLIEQCDLAAGTSSKSSKLIHGGLRYLEQLNFGLVRESLRERGLLLHSIAPHLVTPVPFLLPLRHRVWERAYLGAGVMLYDRLGGSKQLPSGRHLSRVAVADIAPALRPDTYVGGVQFWDAQEDDARFVTFVARTASAHGAAIATRVKATELIVSDGRVIGVQATDTDSGEQYAISARHVATALGAWTDDLIPEDSTATMKVRPSKGVHIVLPKSAIDMDTGLLARTETGLLFVIPWEGYWLVGDTDTEWNAAPDRVTATRADVATLLDRLNSQLRSAINPDQILGVLAGLRPLVAAEPDVATVKLSREHAISSPMPGLSAISGGKYTTYRVMAAQLVDAAADALGVSKAVQSVTATTSLVGADGFSRMWNERRRIATEHGVSVNTLERLLKRYGSCVNDLLDLIDERPSLADTVDASTDTLAAEIVYACTHEGARHLDDVLDRRTRIALQTADRGQAASERVLALMQDTLDWPRDVVECEREQYRRLIADERQDLDRTPAPGDDFAQQPHNSAVRDDERTAQPCDA
jgi:glycerol-3-phosphate dehydrogenase